jgi:spore coat polysaccharide biosynthesis protein SpsF
LLKAVLKYANMPDIDLVTNVQIRTFPIGHSVEMIKSATFARIDSSQFTPEEKEHVTEVYYNHSTKFRIMNIESADPGLAKISFAVDTLEDLFRLEKAPHPEVCSEEETQRTT